MKSKTKITRSQRTYRDRLLFLADFLMSLPKEKFDYNIYMIDTECGTVACALGWAATLPKFNRLGLSVEKRAYGYELKDNLTGSVGASAAARIFGLALDEVHFLFHPLASICDDDENEGRLGCDATTKEVAEHIRSFVKGKFPS